MEETRATWDAQASSFDDEPDHGLRDSVTRQAWWSLLRGALPEAGSLVADLGCGTGTLAVLLAENNYRVRGIDLSPRMIELARRKTSDCGKTVLLEVGDASRPAWPTATFDAVISDTWCGHCLIRSMPYSVGRPASGRRPLDPCRRSVGNRLR